MQDLLSTAIEMHRTGELGPAARLYEQILERERDNSEALHLLGVVHHQQRDHARAVELIGRAAALRPNVPVFHSNLSEVYRALGQFDRAVGCCRTALRLWPDYAEALCNLGLALQAQGKKDEAVAQFRCGLDLRPDFAPLHNNLGIALRELGQLDDALASFRRAVELDPTYAPAQSNLGQMLLDRGQPAEAMTHAQEAARLQPDVAAMHHNLGNVLRALDRLVEARAAYLEALRLAPDLAVAHAHLGLILHREGQLDAALPWLKQSVELEPGNATFWENLGELYSEMEESAEAVPCWQRVLEIDPGRNGARLSLGWSLQEQGRFDEARQYYLAVVVSQPDWAAPHLNLGGLHEEHGELALAEAAFRRALQLQPAFALPHARLATLLRGKLPHADFEALQQRLSDSELGKGPRARLLFALAHVLDAQREYSQAAAYLREANATTLELARGRREYSPSDHEQFVDRILSRFDRHFFAGFNGLGLETRRPVFVFGLPRSGTTLVEQILSSHQQVCGAGELRFVRETFEFIPTVLNRAEAPLNCVPHLDAACARKLAEKHLERLGALDGGCAERVVDKMPDNYMYLGLLTILFPRATFIHCRRDLRDVALSCWMTDFRSIRWANDVAHIAARFEQYDRLMDHWRELLPAPIHEVCYEELVDNVASAARGLLAACGLDWDPACLEFHRTQRPIRTASVTQVRQPIYRRSVARWKNYESELADLFAALPRSPKAVP